MTTEERKQPRRRRAKHPSLEEYLPWDAESAIEAQHLGNSGEFWQSWMDPIVESAAAYLKQLEADRAALEAELEWLKGPPETRWIHWPEAKSFRVDPRSGTSIELTYDLFAELHNAVETQRIELRKGRAALWKAAHAMWVEAGSPTYWCPGGIEEPIDALLARLGSDDGVPK